MLIGNFEGHPFRLVIYGNLKGNIITNLFLEHRSSRDVAVYGTTRLGVGPAVESYVSEILKSVGFNRLIVTRPLAGLLHFFQYYMDRPFFAFGLRPGIYLKRSGDASLILPHFKQDLTSLSQLTTRLA
jgi:hypothetical protein